MSYMTFKKPYACQDVVLSKVFASEERLFPEAETIIGGGTTKEKRIC